VLVFYGSLNIRYKLIYGVQYATTSDTVLLRLWLVITIHSAIADFLLTFRSYRSAQLRHQWITNMEQSASRS